MDHHPTTQSVTKNIHTYTHKLSYYAYKPTGFNVSNKWSIAWIPDEMRSQESNWVYKAVQLEKLLTQHKNRIHCELMEKTYNIIYSIKHSGKCLSTSGLLNVIKQCKRFIENIYLAQIRESPYINTVLNYPIIYYTKWMVSLSADMPFHPRQTYAYSVHIHIYFVYIFIAILPNLRLQTPYINAKRPCFFSTRKVTSSQQYFKRKKKPLKCQSLVYEVLIRINWTKYR